MILAQLSIYPLGEGSSLGPFVREGVKIIEESGYTYQVGGMSTAVEVPQLQDLFDLVAKIRQAQLDKGAKRLVMELLPLARVGGCPAARPLNRGSLAGAPVDRSGLTV